MLFRLLVTVFKGLLVLLNVFNAVFLLSWRRICSLVFRRSSFMGFEEEDVRNKVIVVTGANRGIGLELTKLLAKRGATVVMACRDLVSAEMVVKELCSVYLEAELVVKHLNLASIESIKKFVQEMQTEFNHVDVLVNNAGLMVPETKNKKTEDGLEINFGVNFVGTFLLTNLMLDLLKASSDSRIVNIGSVTMYQQRLDWNNPMKYYHRPGDSDYLLVPYCNSKYALALFTRELSNRFSRDTSIKAYYVCPGIVATDISRELAYYKWYQVRMLKVMTNLAFLSPKESAQQVLYCINGKRCSTESGLLYRRARIWKAPVYIDDALVPGSLPPINDNLSRKIWTLAENILKTVGSKDGTSGRSKRPKSSSTRT